MARSIVIKIKRDKLQFDSYVKKHFYIKRVKLKTQLLKLSFCIINLFLNKDSSNV